jgi:hypothetical protein
MGLEDEARAYALSKKKLFNEELRDLQLTMVKYINSNLYDSHEKDNALRQLHSSVLWAEEAAELHGIK